MLLFFHRLNRGMLDNRNFFIFALRLYFIFRSNYQVWNGKFVWNNFISFDCTLSAVSSRGALKAGRELPSSLHVLGRSDANGVWHYIGKLNDSWDKQVILLLVEHSQG
jgi:hypothetical protein